MRRDFGTAFARAPAVALLFLLGAVAAGRPAPLGAAEDALLARGLALYKRNCSACHGEKGLGDGSAAYLLYPKPRNFSRGRFRLTSTQKGLPGDSDLLQTLRRGMPGSAMPSWGHLPDPDLKALVKTVRHLAIEGKVSQFVKKRQMAPEKARRIAQRVFRPGPPVVVPPKPGKGDLALGKKIYLESCAPCHDADGRGRLKRDLKDERGRPIFARDFTLGIFKGGASDQALALRILRGMPGTPMPSTRLPEKELWSLVRYIQTLIKPGAQARVQQVQKTLLAKHVPNVPDSNPENPAWDPIPATFLPLMPLRWRDERIEGVKVKVVHDGSKIAVHVSWKDASPDKRALRTESFSDAAAMQISKSETPPFLGMGDKEGAVNIWYWKADHGAAGQRVAGAEAEFPNMIVTFYPFSKKKPTFRELAAGKGVGKIAEQDSTFVSGWGSGNPVSKPRTGTPVENLHARGFGTLAGGPNARGTVQGAAVYRNGKWQLVMVRKLKTKNKQDVAFQAGRTVSVGFAVWDGAAGDRNGQKQISIWHKLTLQ